MKIVVMSRGPALYSTRRLIEASDKAGHEVDAIDPLRCYVDIASDDPDIHYRGEELEDVDAVIPRIGYSITEYGTAVLRQFEKQGVYCANESVAVGRSRDKLRLLQLLSRMGIGLPVTGFAHSTRYTKELIDLVGGASLVVKLMQGTHGIGVVLCETAKAAESVIESIRGLDAQFLVQESIKELGGEDIRCFVVGDKVVRAMIRKGAKGEFRSPRRTSSCGNHRGAYTGREASRESDRRRPVPVSVGRSTQASGSTSGLVLGGTWTSLDRVERTLGSRLFGRANADRRQMRVAPASASTRRLSVVRARW